MNCHEVLNLVDAYIDQELSADEQEWIKVHLTGCSSCRALVEEKQQLSNRLRQLSHAGPSSEFKDHLSVQLKTAIQQGNVEKERVLRAFFVKRNLFPLVTRAASYVVVALLGAGFSYYFTYQNIERSFQVQEIISAHSRSLVNPVPNGLSLIEIRAGDTPILKPKFSKKLGFTPTVPDLAHEDYELLGARKDNLFGLDIAAMVYQKKGHKINLFVLPKDEIVNLIKQSFSHKGFNVECRLKNGFYYIAVSDLAKETMLNFINSIISLEL